MTADPTAEERARETADTIVDGLDGASKTPPIFNRAWLREAITAAIRAAEDAEREACELIALRYRDHADDISSRDVAHFIASAIRSRKDKK